MVASAVGQSIFTQADTLEELRAAVRDAVRRHFGDDPKAPRMIRLRFVRDEVIAGMLRQARPSCPSSTPF